MDVDTSRKTIGHRALPPGLDTGLFFVLFYLYVWLAIDPRLVYHSLTILTPYYPFSFQTGWPFFWKQVAHSGGTVEYVARGLSALWAFGWAGALILTAAAWCATVFTDALNARVGLPRGKVLRYVPAVIVLEMYGSYAHPLSILLSLLISLGCFVLYVRVVPPSPLWRLPTLLIGCPVLFLIAGAGSLLFGVMVAIDEVLVGGRRLVAVAALGWAGVLPWAVATLLAIDLKESYGRLLIWALGVSAGIWPLALELYLFFPTMLAAAVVVRARARDRVPARERRSPKEDRSPNAKLRRGALGRVSARGLATAAFFPVIAAVVWFSLDSFTRTVLEMDRDFQQERWADVLRSAERMPPGVFNFRCYRNTMLALYHTGRLGDEMFRYRQHPGVDLLFTPEKQQDMGASYGDSRLFLDLGFVNWAEKLAHEALETSGDVPAVLEQLAIISVVKGRPELARVFLHDLAKHPFEGWAARDMLRRMETDDALKDDPLTARARGNMIDKDIVAFDLNVNELFSLLLERNPHNRMAFELCMATDLADRRLDKVIANLPRLAELSYPRVPRHYQEAWVIYQGGGDQSASDPRIRVGSRGSPACSELPRDHGSCQKQGRGEDRRGGGGLERFLLLLFHVR